MPKASFFRFSHDTAHYIKEVQLRCTSEFIFSVLVVYNDLNILFTACLPTVKFLNFGTPENFAVIYLKFKQNVQTLGYFVKKMRME